MSTLFAWSTDWEVGDGTAISYWFDSWGGIPRSQFDEIDITRPMVSLREAWPSRHQVDPSLDGSVQVEFNSNEDRIKWNWSKDGCYSASSIC